MKNRLKSGESQSNRLELSQFNQGVIMKYRFLILMLCVSGNTLACDISGSFSVEDHFKRANAVFVGYITAVKSDYLADRFIGSLNYYETAGKNQSPLDEPIYPGSYSNEIAVIASKTFKGEIFLKKATVINNITYGCSYSDMPQVGSYGLFFTFNNTRHTSDKTSYSSISGVFIDYNATFYHGKSEFIKYITKIQTLNKKLH